MECFPFHLIVYSRNAGQHAVVTLMTEFGGERDPSLSQRGTGKGLGLVNKGFLILNVSQWGKFKDVMGPVTEAVVPPCGRYARYRSELQRELRPNKAAEPRDTQHPSRTDISRLFLSCVHSSIAAVQICGCTSEVPGSSNRTQYSR